MKLKHIFLSLMLAASVGCIASCSEEDDYSIASGEVISSITTGEASFTAISAEVSGTVAGLEKVSSSSYEVGAMYSTSQDPTAGNKAKGSYDNGTIIADITGLTPGTTYYYCTYVQLQGKVYRYGDVKSFVATDADIATAGVIKQTATTATIQGQYKGSENISGVELGFYVSQDKENVLKGTQYIALSDSIGAYQYSSVVDNLLPSSTYFAVSYMNLNGTISYGDVVEFTTTDQNIEYVDLGLSVYWAPCNLGAEQAEKTGVKMCYDSVETVLNKVNIDADGNYISALPSKSDIKELISNTTQQVETLNGVSGIRFTASNGNSIFVPAGDLWSGESVATNTDYAYTLNEGKLGSLDIESLLCTRTVAQEVVTEGIRIYRSKVLQGDLEGKGNYRVELYNAYGGTNAAPGVLPADVNFETNMKVTFTISGINDGQSHTACIAFASSDWSLCNWDYNESGEASVVVPADGTYSMILHGAAQGAVVFCLDFPGLATACGAENINVRVESVVMDAIEEPGVVRVRNEKIIQGDIENNGKYRVELYNEYGQSKADPAIKPEDIDFRHNMQLTFTISGITNAEKAYKAYFAFGDGDWNPGNWAYNDSGEASCLIKGDGTYTLTLHGDGQGAMVFCVDIDSLSADCGAENIHVTVDKLVMDHAGTSTKQNTTGALKVGDIENNGRIRIEIYNAFGTTKDNSIINPDDIVFSENMAITFKISGINGNLKEGAAETHTAGLEFADGSWGVSYWSDFTQGKYEAPVTGDSTYTVWYETSQKATGVNVLCVDIQNLANDLVDPSLINVELVDIKLDATLNQMVNPDIVAFQNKDGNNVDGRIEIYNEYGNGGKVAQGYYNDMAFNGMCLVEFTISGIDGNLKEGAAGTYTGTMSYADASWTPSYWGGNSYGNATVKGDGTYQVYAYITGDCEGAVVWTVELYGLWQDLVDTSLVKVSIDKIITPRKL